jgi:predicted acyltransferase
MSDRIVDRQPGAPATRSLPLDVFRGITVCFMIIVNNPGTEAFVYAPLQHAHWNGFTPTDLVFPSFLFAVGNAMSFTTGKLSSMGNAAFLRKITQRTFLIFLIGFCLYWLPFVERLPNGHWEAIPFSHTRILGVLQRIALCYFLASLMIRWLSDKWTILLSALFLLLYWLILLRYGTTGDLLGIKGNAGYLLDKLVLGEDHMYQGEGFAFDPEGILSTIPAIVNVIAGYYTGLFLRQKSITPQQPPIPQQPDASPGRSDKKLPRLLTAGAILIILALAWSPLFPINKKLWTSSYVLLTIGLDLLILAALIGCIDVKGWSKWTRFFTVFGKNALFIYILADVTDTLLSTIHVGEPLREWISEKGFQSWLPGASGSLLYALVYMLFCWMIGKWLDWKRIYIKV